MADSSIPVQANVPAQQAASVPIKVFTVNDQTTNGVVDVQAVALVNAFGKELDLLTESTGQRICALLECLISLQIQETGGLVQMPESLSPYVANP